MDDAAISCHGGLGAARRRLVARDPEVSSSSNGHGRASNGRASNGRASNGRASNGRASNRQRVGRCARRWCARRGRPGLAKGCLTMEATGTARVDGGSRWGRGRAPRQRAGPHRVVVPGGRAPRVGLVRARGGTRIVVVGQFCLHAVPTAESGRKEGTSSPGYGHRICRQRPVSHVAVGGSPDEQRVRLPPLQATGGGRHRRRVGLGRRRGGLLVGVSSPFRGRCHPERQRCGSRHRRGRWGGGAWVFCAGDSGHPTSSCPWSGTPTGGLGVTTGLARARPARSGPRRRPGGPGRPAGVTAPSTLEVG